MNDPSRSLNSLSDSLVRDPSRLTRSNSIKGSKELEPLYDAGVVIVTAGGLVMDLSSMAGRIQLQLWFEMSHADNRSRGLAVAGGMLRCALKASWIGGRPVGYEIRGTKGDKRLVKGDDAEIRVVRRIFREFDQGATIESIARGLECDGIRTVKGNEHWCRETIAGILKNPVYAGDFVFNKNAYGKYHTVSAAGVTAGGKRRKIDPADWIVKRGVYPAIIKRDQFDRVQERLATHKSYDNNNGAFLLSQRLRCADCDEPMYGRTMRSRNRQYECRQCHATVNETIVVREIVKAIDDKFDPTRVERELRRMLTPSSPDESRKQQNRLERELEKQKRKLVMLDDDPELIAALRDDIARILSEQNKLNQQCRAESLRIDVERRIQAAVGKVADLPKAIEKANPEHTRTTLRESLATVWVQTRTTGTIRKRHSTLR